MRLNNLTILNYCLLGGLFLATLFIYLFSGRSVDYAFFNIIYLIIFLVGRNDEIVKDAFNPLNFFAILFYLYSSAAILYVQNSNLTIYGDFVPNEHVQYFIIASLLFLLGFVAAQRPLKKTKNPTVIKEFDEDHFMTFFFRFTILIAIICLPFYYSQFNPFEAISYRDWSLESRVDKLQDRSSGFRELFLISFPVTLILCSCVYSLFSRKINFTFRLLALIILTAYLYQGFLSGARASIFLLFSISAFFFHYRIYSFSNFQLFLGAFASFFLVTLMSAVRMSSDLSEIIFLAIEYIADKGFEVLLLSNSSELLTAINGITVIGAIDSGIFQYKYGMLLIEQLLAFTPQIIWPDRPDFASVTFVKTISPDLYAFGGGHGFSLVAEAVWEGGLIGCLIYGFLLGLIHSLGFKFFYSRFSNPVYIFIYSLFFFRVVLLINRSGFIASLKAFIIQALPLIIAYLIYKIYFSAKYENSLDTQL